MKCAARGIRFGLVVVLCACSGSGTEELGRYEQRCGDRSVVDVPGADSTGETITIGGGIELARVSGTNDVSPGFGDSVEDEFQLARGAGNVVLFDSHMVAMLPQDITADPGDPVRTVVFVVDRDDDCFDVFTAPDGVDAETVWSAFQELANQP